MNKAAGVPYFSRITGTPEQPLIELSAIGKIIERQIFKFPDLCEALRILQYVIMPDHIHFVIFVQYNLPKALGRYIGMMKVKCGQQAKDLLSAPSPIFEKDFYDRILRRSHKLDTICNYIRENPYRLLQRHFNPDFFRRINNISINDSLWQAFGNLQLLKNPFKMSVVIHRSDSVQLRAAKLSRWKHLAENGGVLVSPFISQEEKKVRQECEEVNGKIILLTNKPFDDRQKPAAHDFKRSAEGRLLILSPMISLPAGRQTFLYLNSIADYICTQYSCGY